MEFYLLLLEDTHAEVFDTLNKSKAYAKVSSVLDFSPLHPSLTFHIFRLHNIRTYWPDVYLQLLPFFSLFIFN